MARLVNVGFEINNSTPASLEVTASTGSPTIQTGTKRTGVYAGQITSLASTTRKGWVFQVAGSAATGPFFARAYFNIATAPSAENTIMSGTLTASLSGTISWRVTIDGSRQLRLYNGASQVGSASSAVAANTWFALEVWFDKSGANGSHILKARIDQATEFATATNLTITNNILSINVGGNLNGEAQTQGNWFIDDIAINDNGAGGTQTGYPGDGAIVILRPDGAGTSTQWTKGGSAAAATNWEGVDDPTADDGVTFNSSNTLNQTDLYSVSTPAAIASGATINYVSLGWRANSTGTSNLSAARLRIRDGSGGTADGTATSPSGTTWSNYPAAWVTSYTQPTSGVAWTQAQLDAAEIGMYISTGSTRPVQVTAVWLSVDFTAPTAFDQNLTAAFISAASVTYGATQRQEMPAAFIASAAVLYGSIASRTLPAAFVASGSVLYGAIADRTLPVAFIAAASVTYGGTLAYSVDAAFIASASTLYGAIVDRTLPAAFIASGAVLYGARIDRTLDVGFIASASAIYGARVDVTLASAFIASGATLYGAVVDRTLPAGFVASGSVLYGATINRTLDAAFITSGSVTYGAVPTTGTILDAAFITSASVLYGAVADVTLPAGFITSGATTYGALVNVTLPAGFIGSASVTYGATINAAGGDQSLSAAFIASAATLYGARIDRTLGAAFISSTSATYGAIADRTVPAGFISSGSVLYGATFDREYPGAFIGAASQTFAALLSATVDLTAAFLTSDSTLYGGTLEPVVDVPAGFLDSTAAVYGAIIFLGTIPNALSPTRTSSGTGVTRSRAASTVTRTTAGSGATATSAGSGPTRTANGSGITRTEYP